jgi:hypothetical protein
MGFRHKVATHEPTKVPTAVDIAWSAGIFEGEGCPQSNGPGRINVRVTQKDPELLYRLRDWFGGSIVAQGSCKVWLACGDRGRYFLALVYPFLTARRKAQVDTVGALSYLNGNDPAHLSHDQIRTLLDSRPTKPHKKSTITHEEKRQRHREAALRYWSKPGNREKSKVRCAARRAKLNFERLGITSHPERVM